MFRHVWLLAFCHLWRLVLVLAPVLFVACYFPMCYCGAVCFMEVGLFIVPPLPPSCIVYFWCFCIAFSDFFCTAFRVGISMRRFAHRFVCFCLFYCLMCCRVVVFCGFFSSCWAFWIAGISVCVFPCICFCICWVIWLYTSFIRLLG